MSYNDSISTDKDAVRFHIGDTDPSNEALSDQEINYLLGEEGSVKMAAAQAARIIAAKIAKEPSFAFGTFEMDQSTAYQHFVDLAEDLADDAGTGSGLGAPVLAHTPEDDDEFSDVFHMGLLDREDYEEAQDP